MIDKPEMSEASRAFDRNWSFLSDLIIFDLERQNDGVTTKAEQRLKKPNIITIYIEAKNQSMLPLALWSHLNSLLPGVLNMPAAFWLEPPVVGWEPG